MRSPLSSRKHFRKSLKTFCVPLRVFVHWKSTQFCWRGSLDHKGVTEGYSGDLNTNPILALQMDHSQEHCFKELVHLKLTLLVGLCCSEDMIQRCTKCECYLTSANKSWREAVWCPGVGKVTHSCYESFLLQEMPAIMGPTPHEEHSL